MTARSVGVIPARWGSTRFPGKMLHPLCGRPLLEWVVRRARGARRLDAVLVATDDPRILAAAAGWGVEAVMTSPGHPSGTDRVAEAVRGRDAEVVVNVQGDEPLIDPALIDAVAGALLEDAAWQMATAAVPMPDPEEAARPAAVKVVCDARGRALYFSRAPIPFVREPEEAALAAGSRLRHVGLYGYRRAFLERFVAAGPCPLERIEKLEQLRALHLGAAIRVLTADRAGAGVDTPEDVPRAEAALRAAGLAD